MFFATFVYSLAALAWTDRGGSGKVPLLSALLLGVLLIVSLLAFARLIQSLNTLQIQNVLESVGDSGRAVIRTVFVPSAAAADGATPPAAPPAPSLAPVTQTLTYAGRPRAIARLDIGRLVGLARDAGAVVVMECGVGDTLVDRMVLLRVHGAGRTLPEKALLRAVHLARMRTFEQDPKYAIRLLVDIAIRALSPAVNDPTTAVQALDQIEDLLRRLALAELDGGRVHDASGTLRLVFPMPTWPDYLALSFDEIRQFGASSVQVVRRLRSALAGLRDILPAGRRRNEVQQYLDHLDLGVGRSEFDDSDRTTARQEDRQGLGLSRQRTEPVTPPDPSGPACG